EIANLLQKVIVENDRRNGGEEARGGGYESFRNTWDSGAQAGGTGTTESGECVNDAPDGSEEANEGSYGAGRGQPGHALFSAAHFVSRGELHADGDGLQTFQLGYSWVASGGADLALQFAVARRIHCGKRGAGGR